MLLPFYQLRRPPQGCYKPDICNDRQAALNLAQASAEAGTLTSTLKESDL